MQIRKSHFDVVVLISANAEWKEVSASYSDKPTETSPYGQWFGQEIDRKKFVSCRVAGEKSQRQALPNLQLIAGSPL